MFEPTCPEQKQTSTGDCHDAHESEGPAIYKEVDIGSSRNASTTSGEEPPPSGG